MKKILLLCATSRSVRNFRMGLINYLQRAGYEVTVSAFDDENAELIRQAGAKFILVSARNRSINPFSLGKLKKQYVKIMQEEKPDVVLTFVLKPNVYGSFAAKKTGLENIYCFVEGTGDVFINNSLKWKFIRAYVCRQYKKAFKIPKRVFFLNKDDKGEFLLRGLVDAQKTVLIPGIGIDLEKFEQKEFNNEKRFLMVARLLKTKGVIEYCEAARKVKNTYPEVQFDYLGGEGTIKEEDIREYIEDGTINYYGETKDVRPYLEKCLCFVLPSYREGFSVSIMEAQATGRAVITCDTNGTRDAVIEGYNGFLVPVKHSEALAEKMMFMVTNEEKAREMGRNARKHAEENFDQQVINRSILQIIDPCEAK